MKITSRTARKDYERTIAPRSLLKTYLQKRLHRFARFTVHPEMRLTLYRWMGIEIGHHVFVGLDTWLDDQFPDNIDRRHGRSGRNWGRHWRCRRWRRGRHCRLRHAR